MIQSIITPNGNTAQIVVDDYIDVDRVYTILHEIDMLVGSNQSIYDMYSHVIINNTDDDKTKNLLINVGDRINSLMAWYTALETKIKTGMYECASLEEE